jgi:acetyl-CoA C-acetyltransferase/acetyl-CoA acyltransferase 2
MKRAGDQELVFVAAKRTPFGTFGGSLKNHSATDLGVIASRAAITQAGIKPEDIDHVVFGNVQQTSADAIYLARHIGLRCELPEKVPAVTVNRLCGSGFEAVIQGAHRLLLGEASCVLVGGTESMSQAPHVVRGARTGLRFGATTEFEDTLWSSLTDSFTGMPMAMTAEKLAEQYDLSQEVVDTYSVRSQTLHAEAQEKGHYNDEMTPVELKSRKGTKLFEADEHGRADTTVEGLKKLPKVFKKDGVIHAGAASGICDGAAAMILCTRKFADDKGLKPIGRLLNWGVSGCDPTVMGIGPVPAIHNAMERAESKLDDMDLVEINEAFAPQVLACQKELGIPDEKFNVDGGAIAVGHPLGASGARITAHLLYSLKQRGGKVGLGSACIGGGQGIAVIVEAL